MSLLSVYEGGLAGEYDIAFKKSFRLFFYLNIRGISHKRFLIVLYFIFIHILGIMVGV